MPPPPKGPNGQRLRDRNRTNRTGGGVMHNFQTNETMPWDSINEQVHQNYSDWKHAKDLYDAAHNSASRHNLTNNNGGN